MKGVMSLTRLSEDVSEDIKQVWEQKTVHEIFRKATSLIGENLELTYGEGDDLSIIWYHIDALDPYVAMRFWRWTWWRNNRTPIVNIDLMGFYIRIYDSRIEEDVKTIMQELADKLGEGEVHITKHYN